MSQDKKIVCDCSGLSEHLFNTEDEEKVYEYYKCKICGDIICVDISK